MGYCDVCGENLGFGVMRTKLSNGKNACQKCATKWNGSKEEKVFLEKEEEKKMNSIGYFKGQMCPFTQVQLGGTQNVGAAVLFGAPTYNQYTWTHGQCIKEYCSIWDSKNECCSFKTIAHK
jgi:hypothetical protein